MASQASNGKAGPLDFSECRSPYRARRQPVDNCALSSDLIEPSAAHVAGADGNHS